MKKSLLITNIAILSLLFSCSNSQVPESSSSPLIITEPVTGLEMKEGYDSFSLGSSFQLDAKVLPLNATDQRIEYTSSNPEVATVDANGLVSTVGAGSAVVKAKTVNNGFEKSFELDVIDYEKDLEAGSIKGLASKGFSKKGNGIYLCEKFTEDDVAYLKLNNHSGDWYFEATVKSILNKVDETDITATEGFTNTTGVGAIGDGYVYSFGPVSYQRKTFNNIYYDNNFYDATLVTNKTVGGITSGSYTTYKLDLGGEGSYFVPVTQGYKVGILRSENTYHYFINDIYMGANACYVDVLGEAVPALTTYKSGAYFSDLKFIPSNHTDIIKTKLNDALSKNFNDKLFTNPYAQTKTNKVVSKTQNYVVDLNGDLYITNNAEQVILPTKYQGTTWYFEFAYSLSGHSKNIHPGEEYDWAGGSIAQIEPGYERYLALGMTNNPKCLSSKTNTIQYFTNLGYWRDHNIVIDKYRGLEPDDNNFKLGIMRLDEMIYYFMNDQLIYTDMTPYTWERVNGGVNCPAVMDLWGGATKLAGLTLLTDKSEVREKLIELKPYEHEVELPSKVKVIILSGQSNCEGCTRCKDLTQEQYDEYTVEYTNSAIDYYAYSTWNCSNNKFVNVTWGQGLVRSNFGYEIGLAKQIQESDPDNFYVFIKYARGDSDIYANWRSPSTTKPAGYLYEGFAQYVPASLKRLEDMGVDYEIAGMCWMQGERDASFSYMATPYKDNLRCFYNDMCALFDSKSEGGKLKFFDATIKDYGGTYLFHSTINTAKYDLEKEFPDSYHVIETNKQGPDGNPGLDLITLGYDWNHYDPASELKLGRAFGSELIKYTN